MLIHFNDENTCHCNIIDSYLFINLTVDFLYHELFDLVYNSNYLSMM